MKMKYKISKEEAQTLIGMFEIFFRCADSNSTLIVMYGSILSDIYKKLFKIGLSYAEFNKHSTITLSNIETCFVLIVIEFNKDFDTYHYENISHITPENIRDKKLFLSFDQQVPAHLVKHIKAVRALLSPVTGENILKIK